MWSPFVGQKLSTFIAKQNGEYLSVLRELIEAGKVTRYRQDVPAGRGPDAIRYLHDGHASGRIVITL